MTKTIPGFELSRQNMALKEQLLAGLEELIEQGTFILGANVEALESAIAAYCETNFGIGVASGSDALFLSLTACEIGPGDEVITTPFTFYATAGAITRAGARPVFVDIEPETWNINPALIEKKISPRTRAIIPVHLYGCPADMDTIMDIARLHNLKVIEDAAQALGAGYKNKRVGGLGDAGCISFYPTKNLGAFGDGGMVVTNDPEIAARVRLLRVHGAKPKYFHHVQGCNSRLDEMQAAILRIKFNHLDAWTERRRVIANLYNTLFIKHKITDYGVKLPHEPDYAHHVYHQYTVQTECRDELAEFLGTRGIGTTVYYPLPMHLQAVFASLDYQRGDFPVAEKASGRVLSLPMFPELAGNELEQVVRTVAEFFMIKENIPKRGQAAFYCY